VNVLSVTFAVIERSIEVVNVLSVSPLLSLSTASK